MWPHPPQFEDTTSGPRGSSFLQDTAPPDAAQAALEPRHAEALRRSALPPELTVGERFAAWRYETRDGETTKVPYSPKTLKRASSTDPATWAPFDLALRYAEVAGLDGVTRAFAPEDGMVGIDLDKCLDPTAEPSIDALDEWAADIVRRVDSYTEVSPSGRGVKIWAKGTLPPHGRKRGDLEMYQDRRFFSLTCRHLAGTPRAVAYRPDAVATIHREVFGAAPDPADTAGAERDAPALELGDEEVLRLARESPHNGERFGRLWAGDSSDYAVDGNDGESEADAALCELLAYYGGPDPERIDRLFRRSERMRDKWERADYRERTIRLALRGKTRFYGDGLRPPSVGSDGATGCACDCCRHDDGPEVGRLRRLLLERDDLVESQRGIIGRYHAENEALKGTAAENSARFAAIMKALAVPNVPATEKVVAIATAGEVDSQLRRGIERPKLWRQAIVAKTGYSDDTVSASLKRPNSEAAFERRVTRELKATPDGSEQWVSTLEVVPRRGGFVETLEAFASFSPEKSGHGGARLPRCPNHQDADLIMRTTTVCSVCRQEVAPPRETLKPQASVSEGPPHTVVAPGTREPHLAVSAARCERLSPIGEPETNGHTNGNGNGSHDPDRAAAELVAIPLGSDRANGRDHRNGNGTSALSIGPPAAAIPRPGRACICGETALTYRPAWEDHVCAGCGFPAPAPTNGAGP